jgi:hypothetical protein
MVLAKIFWRRYRCEVCGRLFDLPLDAAVLPAHAPRGGSQDICCDGADAVPA